MTIMRKARSWALAAVLAVAAAACGSDNDPEGATLTINNESGTVIGFVYFTDCSDLEWGDDRLDDDEVITNGNERAFNVNPDCYDILVVSFPDFEEQELRDVEISENEDFVWDVPAF